VRDSSNRPLVAATVCLQVKDGAQVLTATTDSNGTYRFSSLHEGTYTLRAEMPGYHNAVIGPVALRPGETKKIDLGLEPPKASAPPSSSTTKPEFFDEPQFTVAGVTDTTNFGGHGSDTVLRTTETLAKETAPLGRELRASIDFFEHQQDKTVSGVYISGGSSRSEVIMNALQTELMVECKTWDPTGFLKMDLPPNQVGEIEQVAPQLVVAVGAAIAAL